MVPINSNQSFTFYLLDQEVTVGMFRYDEPTDLKVYSTGGEGDRALLLFKLVRRREGTEEVGRGAGGRRINSGIGVYKGRHYGGVGTYLATEGRRKATLVLIL